MPVFFSQKQKMAGDARKTALFTQKRVILLSSFGEKEKLDIVEKIRKIPGGVFVDSGVFLEECDLIICKYPCKGEKYLCGGAAGKPLVIQSYIEDCFKRKKWIDSAPYEWYKQLCIDENIRHLYNFPEKAKCESNGKRVFSSWKVLLWIKDPGKKAAFERLLKAGGANLLDLKPPFTSEIRNIVTHIFVGKSESKIFIPLYESKCFENIVYPEYIVEYLINIGKSKAIFNYLVFQNKKITKNSQQKQFDQQNIKMVKDSNSRATNSKNLDVQSKYFPKNETLCKTNTPTKKIITPNTKTTPLKKYGSLTPVKKPVSATPKKTRSRNTKKLLHGMDMSKQQTITSLFAKKRKAENVKEEAVKKQCLHSPAQRQEMLIAKVKSPVKQFTNIKAEPSSLSPSKCKQHTDDNNNGNDNNDVNDSEFPQYLEKKNELAKHANLIKEVNGENTSHIFQPSSNSELNVNKKIKTETEVINLTDMDEPLQKFKPVTQINDVIEINDSPPQSPDTNVIENKIKDVLDNDINMVDFVPADINFIQPSDETNHSMDCSDTNNTSHSNDTNGVCLPKTPEKSNKKKEKELKVSTKKSSSTKKYRTKMPLTSQPSRTSNITVHLSKSDNIDKIKSNSRQQNGKKVCLKLDFEFNNIDTYFTPISNNNSTDISAKKVYHKKVYTPVKLNNKLETITVHKPELKDLNDESDCLPMVVVENIDIHLSYMSPNSSKSKKSSPRKQRTSSKASKSNETTPNLSSPKSETLNKTINTPSLPYQFSYEDSTLSKSATCANCLINNSKTKKLVNNFKASSSAESLKETGKVKSEFPRLVNIEIEEKICQKEYKSALQTISEHLSSMYTLSDEIMSFLFSHLLETDCMEIGSFIVNILDNFVHLHHDDNSIAVLYELALQKTIRNNDDSPPIVTESACDHFIRVIGELFNSGRGEELKSRMKLLFVNHVVSFMEENYHRADGTLSSLKSTFLYRLIWSGGSAFAINAPIKSLMHMMVDMVESPSSPQQFEIIGHVKKILSIIAYIISKRDVLHHGYCYGNASSSLMHEFYSCVHQVILKGDLTQIRLILDGIEPKWLVYHCIDLHFDTSYTMIESSDSVKCVDDEISISKIIHCFFFLYPKKFRKKDIPKTPTKTAKSCVNHPTTPTSVRRTEPQTPTSSRKRKLNLLKRNGKGESLLQQACLKNQLEKVKEYLDLGIDPNMKDYNGWTALHEASMKGYTACVQELLQSPKLDVFVTGENNITALHDAVESNRVEIADMLLQYGGEKLLHMKNSDSETAMDLAKSQEMKNVLSKSRRASASPFNINQVKNDGCKAMAKLPAVDCEIYLFLLKSLIKAYLWNEEHWVNKKHVNEQLDFFKRHVNEISECKTLKMNLFFKSIETLFSIE